MSAEGVLDLAMRGAGDASARGARINAERSDLD